MAKKDSIINFLWGSVLIFLLVITGSLICIEVIYNYQGFLSSADKMRKDFIAQKKQTVKREVERVVEMIHIERAEGEKAARDEIKAVVYEAYDIAAKLYGQNKNTKSDDEIKEIVLGVLGQIFANKSRGLFFISSLSDETALFQNFPIHEEKLMASKSKFDEHAFERRVKDVLKSKSEDFVTGNWGKLVSAPGGKAMLNFVKFFPPFDWVIVNGLEVREIEEKIKTKLLKQINSVRYEKNGYLFAGNWDGVNLAHGAQPELIGKNMWEYEDSKGNKTSQSIIKAAKKETGGFVYYWWKKPDTGEERPKIAFSAGIPDWQLFICSGLYIDDVEQEISAIQIATIAQLKMRIFTFIISVIVVFILFIFLFFRLNKRFNLDLQNIISSFKHAAYSDVAINTCALNFAEFEGLAKSANKMLDDKMKAKHLLNSEKEQLFVTLRSIGDGVITTDTLGNIELINVVAENLTGWNHNEAIGKPLPEVFHLISEETRKVAENPVIKALNEGRCTEIASRSILISKTGDEFYIADCASPITDEANTIRGAVLVFRDVTEKMKTEEALIRSQKIESIGILAGGIAHDFNNILTGVFGLVELAKRKISSENHAYSLLSIAGQSMERAIHLTKQLQTFSRGGSLFLEAVNFQQIILDSANFNLSGSNVKAIMKLPDDLWKIKADKGQISHVIANLIINAQQAMPNGGNLYIEAENVQIDNEDKSELPPGNYVKLQIRDEGVGISRKNLDQIFDPYFSTKKSGNGLGLAIVHNIIIKHRGKISVTSAIDKGTTFKILLPTENHNYNQSQMGMDNLQTASMDSIGRILIMDDEEIVRTTTAEMLKTCGASIDFAEDGKQAVEKYNNAFNDGIGYSAVIMDLTIPGGLGGAEASKEILAIDPDAKIIVASGYSDNDILANYRNYGFKGRVVKPFKIDDLILEIKKVLFKRTL